MPFTETNRAEILNLTLELAERLGQLPTVPGTNTVDDRFSMRTADVSSHGRTLNVIVASFAQLAEGAPALIDWLSKKGATGFKYDIFPFIEVPSPDEDDTSSPEMN